ncbi:MAG: serine/threonine-protein kinase [Candidatus Cryptobacteroides sp.]
MNGTAISGFFDPDGGNPFEDTPVGMDLINPQGKGPFALYKYSKAGRIVVLKAIRNEFRDNPLYGEILRKEFQIGRSLNHPNIREYYSLTVLPEIGECIEMEWIDGCTLEEMLPLCKSDDELCDKIASQILDAVRFIHLKQVLHRDLKPSNILITRNGLNVKLIDFSLSDSDSHFILKGNAGTAVYASPEQIECKPSDFRSDIYSLGVILSEMSGRRKYSRVAAKCTRKDSGKRYKDIPHLEQALFKPSSVPPIVIAVSLATVLAVLAIVFSSTHRTETEEDYVDSETIDKIFRQATDLLEDSGSL